MLKICLTEHINDTLTSKKKLCNHFGRPEKSVDTVSYGIILHKINCRQYLDCL